MSTIRQLMREIVAAHSGDLNPIKLVELTSTGHPDEWAAFADERARTGAQTIAGEVLRGTLRGREEPLPGLDVRLSSRVTLPDGEGGIVYRRFEDCVIVGEASDLRRHEQQVLQPNVDAAREALADFRKDRRAIERAATRLGVSTGADFLKAIS